MRINFMKFLATFIFLTKSMSLAHSEEYSDQDFVYRNCASQSFSPPLLNCEKIWVDKNVGEILIHDVFAKAGPPDSDDKQFYTTRMQGLPITVPSVGYDKKEKWVYGNNLYLKAKKSFRSFITHHDVDVIAVIEGFDRLKNAEAVNNLNNIEAIDHLILTFWYSREYGVEAIGYPSKYPSGDVYFCESSRCLFKAK